MVSPNTCGTSWCAQESAWWTPWLHISFELTSAPATFHSLMNDIFFPFLYGLVLVFFCDIFVFSTGEEQNFEHLCNVLVTLIHQLHAKKLKCTFGTEWIAYLGHDISNGVVRVEEDLTAIKLWRSWWSLREVKHFLEWQATTVSLCRLQVDCSTSYSLDEGKWDVEEGTTFQWLKQVTVSVLRVPDFSVPFMVGVD